MDEQAVHTQPAEAVSASQSIVAQQGQLGDKAAGGEQARSTPGAADGGAVQPTEADAQIDTEGPAPASQAASPASHGAPPTQGAASASASPRLPLPPRLDFEPLPVRPPAQHSAENDGQESPTGGGGGGSPRRRSSIVVAFAKGVGNRLGLRNKGAPGEADGAQAHVDGEDAAAPSAPSADQGGDDSPRRRRPSVTARAAVSEDASGPGQPSTAPSGDAQGDALHIEGASFVSDAQGGDFQSSPKAGAQRAPPHSAPRQGSLQDCAYIPLREAPFSPHSI